MILICKIGSIKVVLNKDNYTFIVAGYINVYNYTCSDTFSGSMSIPVGGFVLVLCSLTPFVFQSGDGKCG